MFGWLKRQIANFRFERAFQQYEREERSRNLAEAEQRFSAVELRAEIKTLCATIEAEADERFGADLQEVQGNAAVCAAALGKREAQLALLKRDYRAELTTLYETLNELKEEIDDLYEQKANAVRRKDRAKASITAWHARSQRSFLGNKGKKLPKHSLFGQSFGDLDGYKYDRDRASSEIVACAEEIGDLKERKQEIGEQIGDVKKCRDQMHALRANGKTRHGLATEIASRRTEMSHLLRRKANLESGRSGFVVTAKQQRGVSEREMAAAELDAQKATCVAAFETRQAHLRRRARFRRIWEVKTNGASASAL